MAIWFKKDLTVWLWFFIFQPAIPLIPTVRCRAIEKLALSGHYIFSLPTLEISVDRVKLSV